MIAGRLCAGRFGHNGKLEVTIPRKSIHRAVQGLLLAGELLARSPRIARYDNSDEQ